MKKLLISIICVLGVAFSPGFVQGNEGAPRAFRPLLTEDFETIQGALHNTTVFWANHVLSSVQDQDVITGTHSLKFHLGVNPGDFALLGGTSASALRLQNNTYRISLALKASDVDFLTIKAEEQTTWQTYFEFLLNPLTGERLDGNGNVIDLLPNESINRDLNTGVITLSFLIDTPQANNSSLAFSARSQHLDAFVLLDDVAIEVESEDILYREVASENFTNAELPLYQTTLLWLHDDEGTQAYFTSDPTKAIDGRSLVYQVNKVGFDILGGSQGQVLRMSGGHEYKISMDVRLIDIAQLVIKVRSVSTDAQMTEMYVDALGQRLPGSSPIAYSESISVSEGVISLSFTFPSRVDDSAYIFLEANSLAVGGEVIIDNILIEEELFTIEDLTYTPYAEANFENLEGVDPLLAHHLVLGPGSPSYTLDVDDPIRGDASLKFHSLTRFRWHTLFETDIDQILIENNRYKFHGKFIFEGISNVKLTLIDENANIFHEMFFNATTFARTQTFGKAYLDNGSITYNRGKIYVDFRFPELLEDVAYTLQFSVYSLANDASVILDDFSVLRESAPIIPDETPRFDAAPITSPETTLPTGATTDAVIIPSSLSGSPLSRIITVSILSGTILIGSIVGGIFLFKKEIVMSKKASLLSLFVVVSVGVPLIGFTSFVTFPKTIDRVLNTPLSHLADYQYIYPDKIEGHLSNPGMGWVSLEEPTYGGHPDMGTSGLIPEVDNISLSTSWAHIEIEEGIYDFTLLDQVIDFWTSHGKRINFRIATDTLMLPATYNGTPQWLFDKYNIPYEIHNYTDPGPVRTYRVVDTRDQNYQRHLKLFLEALAKRYEDNTMIDVIEIRGWGNWGEWHSGYTYPSMDNRMNALAEIIDTYVDAFKQTGKLLVLSSAWDPYHMPYNSYEDYIAFSAFDYLMTLENATFRRDSGGNLLNFPTDERLMSDFFRSGKRLPLLGEYASGYQQALDAAYGFDLEDGINDILFKMRPNHITTLGWVNSNVAHIVDDGNSSLWNRGNSKMGYRLAVDQARLPKRAKQGDTMALMLAFSNSSLGRFWYEYPLEISLIDDAGNIVHQYIDTSFDARTFINGETNYTYLDILIPSSLENGTYGVAVAIVDDAGNPAIKLGMAGEIDATMRYLLGDVHIHPSNKTPAPVEKTIESATIESTRLAANTTYALTFSYLPGFDIKDYHFGDERGYSFAATSKKGNDAATVGYLKWQDVSGEVGTKTVFFTTHNHDDYQLQFLSEGYGDLTILEVKIETLNGYYEHFEGYDFLDLDSVYLPINAQVASLTTNERHVLAGNESIYLSSNRRGDQNTLKFDTNVYALERNATYTISFKTKTTTLVGNGGYMYLNLEDETNNTFSRIGEWYERMDRGMTTMTYTFNTTNALKQSIAWGIRNSGDFVIDDITLIKHPKGTPLEGTDVGFPQNERPIIDLAGLGDVEGFEALSFNETAFTWGQFGWGQLTYDPKLVISGNASLLGKVAPEAIDNEWFEFARSKPSAFPIEANSTYRIQFDYRVLKNPSHGGFFYILMRDLGVGLPSDAGFYQIPYASAEQINTVQSVDITITTHNHLNYSFIFGMHMLGEIVIDNVKITPLD